MSDETRARILTIAGELGWYPNRAARALSAARADVCGLVMARPAKTLALEPFFMEFIAGAESELSSRSMGLTIQLASSVEEEIEVYRRWWGERRVDGVLVLDLRVDDPRVAEVAELGLPAVVVGGPVKDRLLPAVWHDEASAVVETVRYLAALAHERIAYVAGDGTFVHTLQRVEAFRAAADELELPAEWTTTDYTTESGARETRRLLSSPSRPTAVIFDSELLAVTGLGVAQQMGFAVPDEISIVGWDSALISQVVHPPLTAITRDITAFGVLATQHLLQAIEQGNVGDVQAPRGELTPRGSTGRRRLQRSSR